MYFLEMFYSYFCEAKTARMKLGELTLAKRAKSADDFMEVVKSPGSLLRALDETWSLENALLRSLCGSTAEARVSTKILMGLPTRDREAKLEVACQRLEVMASSAALKLSPTGVQAGLRFIIKNLQALRMGITLSEKLDSCSALVKKALGMFAHFLRCQNPTEPLEVLSGEDAYAVILTEVEQAHQDSREIPTEKIEELQLYIWLAPPGKFDAVAALIKELLKAVGKGAGKLGKGAKKAKAEAEGRPGSSGDAGSKAAKKASLGMDAAMRYFD